MSRFIEMFCEIFGCKKYRIRIVAKRLCSNITLSMNNGDKFYSFNDYDFRVPRCGKILSQDLVINSSHFVNFIIQSGIIVRKYKGKIMIDYPK